MPLRTRANLSWWRRLRAGWRRTGGAWLRDYEWPMLAVLAVVALVLGYIGFRRVHADRSWTHALYLSMQLFTLESGAGPSRIAWELDVARFLAPGVAVFAAAKALTLVFREQVQLMRVRLSAGHVVICGLGRKGWLAARAFHERGDRVVVVERDPANEQIADCRELGIPVLVADATDATALLKARVEKANYLICVCGADETNAEIAMNARDLALERRGGPLVCYVHVVDPQLCELLRERQAPGHRDASFRLEFFNVYETGGRAWLTEYPPVEAAGDAERAAHVIVVGVGQMGKNLTLGAVRSWLTLHPSDDRRMRVTLIDRYADRKKEWLALEHPQLERFCEVEARPMEINSPEFARADFCFDAEGRCTATAIYVCLDDTVRSLAAAITLLQRVKAYGVPIVVRMVQEMGLASLVTAADGRRSGFEHLHAFPVLDRTIRPEMLLGETPSEILARAIHHDYLRQQAAADATHDTNPMIVSWGDLPEELKESNRRQASHILVKLGAVGRSLVPLGNGQVPGDAFTQEETELLSEMEHNRWMAERLFEGWSYAPGQKDVDRRTSPDLVPWDELPEGVRDVDREFVMGIPAFLAKIGYRMQRVPTGGP